MKNLEFELKQLIITLYQLDDLTADDINSEAALFGAGLGLDSIDALELGIALKKRYHIHIDDTQTADLAKHFASINTLAQFISTRQHLK